MNKYELEVMKMLFAEESNSFLPFIELIINFTLLMANQEICINRKKENFRKKK